jgi:hypothetical protein
MSPILNTVHTLSLCWRGHLSRNEEIISRGFNGQNSEPFGAEGLTIMNNDVNGALKDVKTGMSFGNHQV